MIFCSACRKFWPKGTAYCGSCGASLGKRFCPDGHENRLDTQACTTCGSRRLTRGVRGIQLRLLTWLLGFGILWLLFSLLFLPLMNWLLAGLAHVGFAILTAIAPLLVLSILVSVFCGEKGRAIIFNFWLGAIRVTFGSLELAFQLLVRRVKKQKKGKEKDQ